MHGVIEILQFFPITNKSMFFLTTSTSNIEGLSKGICVLTLILFFIVLKVNISGTSPPVIYIQSFNTHVWCKVTNKKNTYMYNICLWKLFSLLLFITGSDGDNMKKDRHLLTYFRLFQRKSSYFFSRENDQKLANSLFAKQTKNNFLNKIHGLSRKNTLKVHSHE